MKRELTLLTALLFLCLLSCTKQEKTEPEKTFFSDAQTKALKVINGSFSYTIADLTTTITFLEQYNPPKTGILDNGTEIPVHGKYRIVYYAGQTFERYFFLSNAGDKFYSFIDLTNIISIETKDFRIVDDNTFQWKTTKDVLWDTYIRK